MFKKFIVRFITKVIRDFSFFFLVFGEMQDDKCENIVDFIMFALNKNQEKKEVILFAYCNEILLMCTMDQVTCAKF